jgi:hypothetical protein
MGPNRRCSWISRPSRPLAVNTGQVRHRHFRESAASRPVRPPAGVAQDPNKASTRSSRPAADVPDVTDSLCEKS